MKKLKLFLSLGVLLAGCFLSFAAKADLTITPTRIVFEDRDRFKEVTLVNSGKETKTYDVSWQFYKMLEDGPSAMELVEGPLTDFDLSQYIVFTPRRMTLAPGATQKIRLALRRPAEIADGEYRAHLRFRGERNEEKISQSKSSGTQSAAVKVNVSYSIPVIFRAGTPNVSAKIENVTFQRNPNNDMLEAVVTITKSPEPYGVLGHMYIYDQTNKVIGEIGNAHIFPEISKRVIRVPLIDESNLKGGNIRIVLGHYSKDENLTYDERTIPVQ
ncbi:MAG: molecular chaperone [Rhodospirillales bacterium]|nr:molecular chaperone [Rhodospirillales bacterium]